MGGYNITRFPAPSSLPKPLTIILDRGFPGKEYRKWKPLDGQDDCLVKVQPILDLIPDWENYIQKEISEDTLMEPRKHEQTVRPFGSQAFVSNLENALDRIVRPLKPWETKSKW